MKIYVLGFRVFEHEIQRLAMSCHRIYVKDDSFVMHLLFTLLTIKHNFIEKNYLKLEVEKQSLLFYSELQLPVSLIKCIHFIKPIKPTHYNDLSKIESTKLSISFFNELQ